jgi:hypothetical protein
VKGIEGLPSILTRILLLSNADRWAMGIVRLMHFKEVPSVHAGNEFAVAVGGQCLRCESRHIFPRSTGTSPGVPPPSSMLFLCCSFS